MTTDKCAICLCKVEDGYTTACGHLFHTICLLDSIMLNPLCPLCRTRIPKYKEQQSTSNDLEVVVEEANPEYETMIQNYNNAIESYWKQPIKRNAFKEQLSIAWKETKLFHLKHAKKIFCVSFLLTIIAIVLVIFIPLGCEERDCGDRVVQIVSVHYFLLQSLIYALFCYIS